MLNLTIGLLWLIAIAQGLVIIALVQQVASLRTMATAGGPEAVDLPVGSLAPQFAAVDMQSQQPILSSTLSGRRIVICFMNADCHVCRTLAFELSNKSTAALAGLIVYYDGVGATSGSVFQALAEKIPVLCKDGVDVAVEFHIAKFPAAVVIDARWRVLLVSHPVRADDLLTLLTEAVEQPSPAESTLTRLASEP